MPWDEYSDEDPFWTDVENKLGEYYGRNVGLNSDWSVSAWSVGRNRYITDNENGTYSLVQRVWDDDDEESWDNIYEEKTWSMESHADLRRMMRELGRAGF